MTGKVPKSNDTNLNMESLWNTLKHKMTVSCRFTSSHHDRNFRVDFLEDLLSPNFANDCIGGHHIRLKHLFHVEPH